MKRWMIVAALLGGSGSGALAVGGPFGLGVILGEPTGISAKYWMDGGRQYAVDAGAAWSLSGDNKLHLHGDYLFHQYGLLKVEKGKLPVYFGVGGRVEFRDNRDDEVGIRIPVGLDYLFDGAPLELFVEVVPIVDLAPDTELDFNGGVGIRFFF